MAAKLDRIRIKNLKLTLIIGAYDSERLDPQEILLDVSLWGDWTKAAQSDNLGDALDYKQYTDQLTAHLAPTQYILLERLAAEICDFTLTTTPAHRVKVTIEKPQALAPARVRLTLNRTRKETP